MRYVPTGIIGEMAKFEFPFRGETKRLTQEERARLPGEFIKLSDGVTHYELGGPVDGQVVVLVHGFSVPYFIWDPTFEALTKAGFWTLRYDLYGRGYSDRPNEGYDVDLFERQLSDLLDALGFKEKVNVVGLSMGGIISAAFAIRHPKRVAKLGLVDPAGFPLNLPLTFRLLTVRGLGEVMLNFVGVRNLENSIASDFYEPKHIKEFMELYSPQMEYKGFRRAILSTIREGVLDRRFEIYEGVGMSDLPVLLVWGVEDNTVPFRHSAALVEAIPQVEFHPIEEAGHIPHYEKPEVVNPILIEFLRR